METQIIDIIISLIIVVMTLAGLWKAFEKAGRKGWEGIVPVYNQYVMLRLAGLSGWWIAAYLLPIIPLVVVSGMSIAPVFGGVPPVVTALAVIVLLSGFIISIVQTIINYEMSRLFGKGLAFTFGLIFFPFIFWPILGFGDAIYAGSRNPDESSEESKNDKDADKSSREDKKSSEDGWSLDDEENSDDDWSSEEDTNEADSEDDSSDANHNENDDSKESSDTKSEDGKEDKGSKEE
jgi:hypothetical protein